MKSPGKTITIRLPEASRARITRLKDSHGISQSDVIRLSLTRGLPFLENGHILTQQAVEATK